MKIPYVIDNQTHRLANILNTLLAEHKGRSLDVATAYFTVGGFGLLKDGLLGLGNFRLLLGAEPTSGEQLGLRPDAGSGSWPMPPFRQQCSRRRSWDARSSIPRPGRMRT